MDLWNFWRVGVQHLNGRPGAQKRERFRHGLFSTLLAVGVAALSSSSAMAEKSTAANTPIAQDAVTVAFLGVRLQNDNDGLEPTSDAEQQRLQLLEDVFKSKLTKSGRYTFMPMTDEVKAKIKAGQFIGECGGCEVDYGRQLGATLIAWVTVQKVSNLILNLNVFIADVATEKMTFVHSVDIRGNTDESWSRSLVYLVDNYLLQATGM